MTGHIADVDELQAGFAPDVPRALQRAKRRRRHGELVGWIITADMPRHIRPQLIDDARGDVVQHGLARHSPSGTTSVVIST